MRIFNKASLAAAVFAFLLGIVSNASASFIFYLAQVGPNVVLTGSGMLDTSALSFQGSAPEGPIIYPSLGIIGGGVVAGGTGEEYFGASGPSNFGSGGPYEFDVAGNGDDVGINGSGGVFVPLGYVSGSPLSDTDIFYEVTFASLGVTPGQYRYKWGTGPTADSLTINIGVVPEPASLALLSVPAAIALLRRRRGVV